MKKLIMSGIALLSVGIVAGCQAAPSVETDQLQVKTTVYPLTYLVEAIAGDFVDVTSILPAGADAHDYDPTQQDIIALGESDVFFYIGIGDQELLVDKLESVLTSEKVTFSDVAATITPIYGDSHDHNHEDETQEEHAEHADELSADPHVWLDPMRMGEMATHVYETLVELLPEQEATLTQNYTGVTERLVALDADYEAALAELENVHTLVTHNAYGYWEDRYDLEIIALSDLANNAELTQQEIIAISEEIEHEGIEAIFTAPNIQSQYTQNFVNQFDLQTFEIQNLETLTQVEMSAGDDYFSVMQANLEALVSGLSLQTATH